MEVISRVCDELASSRHHEEAPDDGEETPVELGRHVPGFASNKLGLDDDDAGRLQRGLHFRLRTHFESQFASTSSSASVRNGLCSTRTPAACRRARSRGALSPVTSTEGTVPKRCRTISIASSPSPWRSR